MKLESLREVKNHFSEVIAALPRTGPVIVTRNGKGAALLIAIDEDTDLETLVLSNSPKFWAMFDRAAAEERIPMEAMPAADDETSWEKFK
jgi:prevent-host-death family protein